MSTIILSQNASNAAAWDELDAALAASCAVDEEQCHVHGKKSHESSMKLSQALSMARFHKALQAPTSGILSPTSSLSSKLMGHKNLLAVIGEAERICMGELDTPQGPEGTGAGNFSTKEFAFEYDPSWNEFCDDLPLED